MREPDPTNPDDFPEVDLSIEKVDSGTFLRSLERLKGFRGSSVSFLLLDMIGEVVQAIAASLAETEAECLRLQQTARLGFENILNDELCSRESLERNLDVCIQRAIIVIEGLAKAYMEVLRD